MGPGRGDAAPVRADHGAAIPWRGPSGRSSGPRHAWLGPIWAARTRSSARCAAQLRPPAPARVRRPGSRTGRAPAPATEAAPGAAPFGAVTGRPARADLPRRAPGGGQRCPRAMRANGPVGEDGWPRNAANWRRVRAQAEAGPCPASPRGATTKRGPPRSPRPGAPIHVPCTTQGRGAGAGSAAVVAASSPDHSKRGARLADRDQPDQKRCRGSEDDRRREHAAANEIGTTLERLGLEADSARISAANADATCLAALEAVAECDESPPKTGQLPRPAHRGAGRIPALTRTRRSARP